MPVCREELRKFDSTTGLTPHFIHDIVTNQPTNQQSNTVLLEKLRVSRLVKKFPVFYGNRRFITAIATARHCALSWARCIQSATSHPISSSPVVSTHIHLCHPLEFPSLCFPTKIPTAFLFSSMSATWPAHLVIFQIITSNNILWRVHIMRFLITQFPPIPYYLLPLRPQHPTLEHHVYMALTQSKIPSFTPIQSNMQNYGSDYFNIYVFR